MLYVVKLPDDAQAHKDYQWARKHSEFGFTARFRDQPDIGDIVMLCSGVKAGKKPVVGHILLACVLSAPSHPDAEIPPVKLSLPSEVEERKRKYIQRMSVTFFGEQADNDASTLHPLFDALRRSAKNSTPRKVDATGEELDAIASNFGYADWNELERATSFPFKAVDTTVTRAEDLVCSHYEADGWDVIHVGYPYTFLCRKGGEDKRVAVNVSDGNSIRLTPAELASVRKNPTDLAVVDGAALSILENWHPQEADLTPAEFEYRLP